MSLSRTLFAAAWLWIGTTNGVARFDGVRFHPFGERDGLPSLSVTCLLEDGRGTLWIGTLDGGPAYLSGEKIARPSGIEALASDSITTILADNAGRIWFGSAGQGLARLDAEKLTRWTQAEGLASQFIRTLHEDSADTIWIGTSGGLARWQDGKLFNFTPVHGLPDAVISQILDDHADHLWLGTNGGILRVPLTSLDDVASASATAFDGLALNAGDGLPSLECTGGYHSAGLRLADGRLCFGTAAGVAVIDPKNFATPSPTPPVVIEEIALGSAAPVAPGNETWIVPADAGRVEFRFTALAFTAPERVRFRYRMSGLESAWLEAGATRTASYTHLPAGDFRFEQAC